MKTVVTQAVWRTLLLGFVFAPAVADETPVQPVPEPQSARQVTLTAEARAEVFRPFQTDWASLSPDGKYLAYTYREGSELFVVVFEVDHPQFATAKVLVGTDDSASPHLGILREKRVATVRWMRWVTPTRLVLETNRNFVVPRDKHLASGPGAALVNAESGFDSVNVSGAIFALDADGKNAKTLVTPFEVPEERFAEPRLRSRPVAWRPDQPISNAALAPAAPVKEDPNDPNLLVHTYRSPTVFDLCSTHPDSIWIQAAGVKGFDILRLNVVTGELRKERDEIVDPEMTVLTDRHGAVRIGMRNSARISFPHVFRIVQNRAFSRWKDIDVLAGNTENPSFRVSPDDFFGERAIPLGFNEEGTVLYYASNSGRDKYGIYGLDLATGRRNGEAIEHPDVDLIEPSEDGFSNRQELIYDRFDHRLAGVRYQDIVETALWLRPEWTALQSHLEKTFPGQSIRILDWDQSGRRYLFLARSLGNPGGFYLFDGRKGTIIEFAQRSPWTRPDTLPKTVPFAFNPTPDRRIAGSITLPTMVRMKPVPMVVMLQEDPWRRTSNEYDSRVQALTNNGLAVVQVNARGAWGFGVKFREAVRQGFEAAQVEDIVATIDYLATQLPVTPKRVALFGVGRGAYTAIRALQLKPDRFRCAVALEPTVNLDNWLGEATWSTRNSGPALTQALLSDAPGLKGVAVVAHEEPISRPVQFVVFPGPRGATRTQAYLDVRRLNDRMNRRGESYERIEVDEDYLEGLPLARSDAFREIENFLNEHIYGYDVRLGTPAPMRRDGRR